jgi:hypothetical protein
MKKLLNGNEFPNNFYQARESMSFKPDKSTLLTGNKLENCALMDF